MGIEGGTRTAFQVEYKNADFFALWSMFLEFSPLILVTGKGFGASRVVSKEAVVAYLVSSTCPKGIHSAFAGTRSVFARNLQRVWGTC